MPQYAVSYIIFCAPETQLVSDINICVTTVNILHGEFLYAHLYYYREISKYNHKPYNTLTNTRYVTGLISIVSNPIKVVVVVISVVVFVIKKSGQKIVDPKIIQVQKL